MYHRMHRDDVGAFFSNVACSHWNRKTVAFSCLYLAIEDRNSVSVVLSESGAVLENAGNAVVLAE